MDAAALDAQLTQADALCKRRGARFTAIRRQILALVLAQAPTPVGAYALLDQLRQTDAAAAPPTVYRALDFLMAQGLIHRVARLNAFVACAHLDRPHLHAQLICTQCGQSVELCDSELEQVLSARADALGFRIQDPVIEATGICAACSARC